MFNNLVFYRFTRSPELTAEALAEQLSEHCFAPCRAQEVSRSGWVPPMGKLSEQLVHTGKDRMLIAAQKEEKILPPSVIREFLNERIEQIESEQDRTVRKTERNGLRDEIVIDLLPKAFSKYSTTRAYIDLGIGLLVVDSSTAKRAEELCSLLRHTLGSLPVAIPAMNKAPASVMTEWLRDEQAIPTSIVLGHEAELKDPSENGAVLRCKNEDLLGDEIRPHLDGGKQALKLAISWRESLSAVVGDDLIVRRLKQSDTLLDQAADMGAADAAAAFEADFFILTEQLSKFIPELMDALGGENHSAYDPAGFELAGSKSSD